MRPVVVIRHQEPHEVGLLGEAFDRRGVPFAYLDAWTGPSWPAVDDVAGVVVLGGEMSAHEEDRYPFLATERALLAEAVGSEVPVLGICLGAQVLARALGAKVSTSPVAELGFRPIRHTAAGHEDRVLGPFEGVPVFQWHSDTFDLPDGAELLASSDGVPHQAFRSGPSAYGLQFHPEATQEAIAVWARAFADAARSMGRTPEQLVDEARERLPVQRRASERALAAFAELVDTR